MKRHSGKLVALLLAAVMGLMCLAGCNNEAGKTDADTVGAVFEGDKIYLDEVKFYVYTTQYEVEKNSEAMIAAMYADYQSFWQTESEGATYWDMGRDTAMEKMYQTKVLCAAAEKEGVSLNADEQAKVAAGIERVKTDLADVVKAAGATDEIISKFVTENALANKYFNVIVDGIDKSYDDAAMKRSNVEGLTVIAKTDYTPVETDEDGKTTATGDKITYTEEEQIENREKTVEEIYEKINGGASVVDVAAEYVGSETVTVYSLGTLEISQEDAPKAGAEFTSYRHLAWSMSTGDVESGIYNNSNNTPIGYVLRCVNDDDQDLKQKAIDKEYQQRENVLFGKECEKLMKKFDRFHVYQDYLYAISFTGSLFASEYVSPVPTSGE